MGLIKRDDDDPTSLSRGEFSQLGEKFHDEFAEVANQENACPRSGKTVLDWALEQEEFKDMPKLMTNWIRIRSSTSNKIYYMNTLTGESQFTEPMPELAPGWV